MICDKLILCWISHWWNPIKNGNMCGAVRCVVYGFFWWMRINFIYLHTKSEEKTLNYPLYTRIHLIIQPLHAHCRHNSVPSTCAQISSLYEFSGLEPYLHSSIIKHHAYASVWRSFKQDCRLHSQTRCFNEAWLNSIKCKQLTRCAIEYNELIFIDRNLFGVSIFSDIHKSQSLKMVICVFAFKSESGIFNFIQLLRCSFMNKNHWTLCDWLQNDFVIEKKKRKSCKISLFYWNHAAINLSNML